MQRNSRILCNLSRVCVSRAISPLFNSLRDRDTHRRETPFFTKSYGVLKFKNTIPRSHQELIALRKKGITVVSVRSLILQFAHDNFNRVGGSVLWSHCHLVFEIHMQNLVVWKSTFEHALSLCSAYYTYMIRGWIRWTPNFHINSPCSVRPCCCLSHSLLVSRAPSFASLILSLYNI